MHVNESSWQGAPRPEAPAPALTEAQQQTRLSDAGVSNQKELEQEIAEHEKGGVIEVAEPTLAAHSGRATPRTTFVRRRRFAGVCSQSHSLFAHSENAFATRQGSMTGDTKKYVTDKLGL